MFPAALKVPEKEDNEIIIRKLLDGTVLLLAATSKAKPQSSSNYQLFPENDFDYLSQHLGNWAITPARISLKNLKGTEM